MTAFSYFAVGAISYLIGLALGWHFGVRNGRIDGAAEAAKKMDDLISAGQEQLFGPLGGV